MLLFVFQFMLFPVMTLWLVVMGTPAVNLHRESGPVVLYPRYKHTSVWIMQPVFDSVQLHRAALHEIVIHFLPRCAFPFSCQWSLQMVSLMMDCTRGARYKYVLFLHSFKHNEQDSAWLMQEFIQSWHKFQFPCLSVENSLREEGRRTIYFDPRNWFSKY